MTRKKCWVVLVWIVIGMFVFPLTPPISQHYPQDVELLVQSSNTQVLTHQETIPTKQIIQTYIHVIHSHDDLLRLHYIFVFVLFIPFLLSKIREQLKEAMLAFRKFMSMYVGLIHTPSL